jgi:iron complex transport system permease protein
VSSSAALGGVLAIFLGLSAFPFAIFGFAMAGSGASILILVMMARGGRGPLGFILGGMIVSTMAGSLTAFLISIAPNPFATSEIISWLMGALTDRSIDDVAISLPFLTAGSLILLCTGPALDGLALGEDGARSLGFDLQRLQWLVVLGCGLAVGASVAVSGVVGFVGLIVPHVMRHFIGAKPSSILIPSALGGAILLLTADSLVRLLPGVGEVRLGIVMALFGAPFFFIIMVRRRTDWVS